MVERNTDEDDKRRILVALTRKGNAAVDKLSSIHLEELRSICPTLRKLSKQFEAKHFTQPSSHDRQKT